MKTEIHKRKIAKIEVQRSFCTQCGLKIQKELKSVGSISNVVLYPESATVIFGFSQAKELSTALNILTQLGFPEIGEVISTSFYTQVVDCTCKSIETAA